MIRPATVADAGAIARLHIRAWQAAYRGFVSDEFLDNLSIENHTAAWSKTLGSNDSQTLVFDDHGIEGWICYGRGRDATSVDHGEIYALYIDPENWRTGIGRQLMHCAEASLRNDFQQIYLWVLTDNIRGRQFYEAVGYTASADTKNISWAGATLAETKYIKCGG